MQLQDIENEILVLGQWPGSNPGGAPSWTASGQFNQKTVDFAINRAYERLASDIGGIQLSSIDATISSVANTFQYNIPGAGNPVIQMVTRVQYQPSGLTYVLEYMPGARLISWRDFQDRYTGDGYLQPFSFGTQPDVVTINPERTQLWIFPGSAGSGDTITVSYVPVPTAGSSVPLLVAETDVPIFPTDAHQAIVFYSMYLLMWKARQPELAKSYKNEYEAECKRIKDNWWQTSAGDNLRFRDGRFTNAGTKI